MSFALPPLPKSRHGSAAFRLPTVHLPPVAEWAADSACPGAAGARETALCRLLHFRNRTDKNGAKKPVQPWTRNWKTTDDTTRASLQNRDRDERRVVATYQGHQVVSLVRPEDGKGLAVQIGIVEPPGLDDCPDVVALRLQLTLKHPRAPPFRHLFQTLRGVPTVLPHSANGK